eukprot:519774-Prorocentrum_minimum.AAC.1
MERRAAAAAVRLAWPRRVSLACGVSLAAVLAAGLAAAYGLEAVLFAPALTWPAAAATATVTATGARWRPEEGGPNRPCPRALVDYARANSENSEQGSTRTL